jgi:hypothetical protein
MTTRHASYSPAPGPFKRIAAGDSKAEALRALQRRLSDIVYRTLMADGTPMPASLAA